MHEASSHLNHPSRWNRHMRVTCGLWRRNSTTDEVNGGCLLLARHPRPHGRETTRPSARLVHRVAIRHLFLPVDPRQEAEVENHGQSEADSAAPPNAFAPAKVDREESLRKSDHPCCNLDSRCSVPFFETCAHIPSDTSCTMNHQGTSTQNNTCVSRRRGFLRQASRTAPVVGPSGLC